MSVSGIYGVIHRTMVDVGREHGITGADVRLLVALAEHGSLRSDEIETRTGMNATQIRRSSLVLRDRLLIIVCASSPSSRYGGRVRRGNRMRLALTEAGRHIACKVLAEMEGVVPDEDRREMVA